MKTFSIADFIARIHIASCKFIRSVIVLYNLITLKLLSLLLKEGYIEGFTISFFNIQVFIKFNFITNKFLFKNIKLISTPGRRQF